MTDSLGCARVANHTVQCVIPDFTSAQPLAPPAGRYCLAALTPGSSFNAASALLICSRLRTSTVKTMWASERRLCVLTQIAFSRRRPNTSDRPHSRLVHCWAWFTETTDYTGLPVTHLSTSLTRAGL